MDMIAADDSASQVSDKIKDILYAKSSERVDEYRPAVAAVFLILIMHPLNLKLMLL